MTVSMSSLSRQQRTGRQNINLRTASTKNLRSVTLDSSRSKYDPKHPYSIGARLLKNSKLFHFTQQVRTQDREHMSIVQKLYNLNPIDIGELKNKYKLLSSGDFRNYKSPWFNAPVIVATNRERNDLTHEFAIRFAKARGQVVLRWPSKRSNWSQKPRGEFVETALEDPCFYEYFVRGAPAYINEAINSELHLYNGTQVYHHSLSFEDEDTYTTLQNYCKEVNAGTVINIPKPTSVNISMLPPENDSEAVNILQKLSFLDNQIVIPIIEGRTQKKTTLVRGSPFFRPSRVSISAYFPIELGFAITMHKAQGRTLSKVILSLSYNPASQCDLSYAQIYVALSRVRCGDDIRLLLTGETEKDKWESISYLTNLQPDTALRAWFDGFNQSKSNQKEWQSISWDENETYMSYKSI